MPSNEENIQQELISKFDFLKDKVKIARAKRVFVDVPADKFASVLEYAFKQMKFNFISAITGLDEGASLSALYHINRKDGIMLNLKLSVPKDKPVIRTIIKVFPSAEIFERELKDLLGFEVEGLPEGKRYPLPEDWPAKEFPLRKEWKSSAPSDASNKTYFSKAGIAESRVTGSPADANPSPEEEGQEVSNGKS